MKRILISVLCSLPVLGFGQILFYNDGAMVKVQAGAVLFVEGGMQNTATGTIDNDGIIEVQGNFVNAGTWEPSQPNTLRFSGNGNSDVTSGPAVFQTVENIKGTGANINLLDPMTINTDLNFNSAGATRVVTGNFDLKLGPTATVTGPDADEYVATTGTGMMQKAVTANNTFVFPVGDITNYSPLSCVYTGSAYSNANLRAKANDLTHPNNPFDATDYISRYWDLNQTGITTYSNTMTGTYIPADVVGSAALIKGAIHNGTDWFYVNAAGGANTVTGTTTYANSDFTGTDFYGKAILKVFLSEALPVSGTPPMNTELWNGQGVAGCSSCPNLIPTASPYSAAPWNAPVTTAPSIPANTIDWILVETRDPSINLISQTSAFLINDGTIVSADGNSLKLKNAVPSAIISIRHRNHLGIRTVAALDLVNPTLWDFSTDTLQAYRNPAISNSNMRLVGPTWSLWGGNANLAGTGLTKISFLALNNDPQAVLSAMGGNNNNPLLEVYHISDVNMNRKVSYLALANDPQTILSNMGGNNNNPRFQHL